MKGKPTKKRRRTPPKRQRSMPKWVGVMWAALIVCCFSVGFYYFSVRPYAYRWRACNGYRDYGVCIPSNYAMHGIDISHHQGDIDWRRLATARQSVTPLSFVFLKATEGGDHADTAFAANFDSAKQAGFVRGAYHFYIPSTDALKQADFFINTVRLDSGDLAPVLDVELPGKSGKGRKEELARGVKQWLDRVEAHYGVKPILYTSYKFKTRYLNDTIFDAYPYWIAHYYVDSVQYRGRWHFWQHTDRGRVPGIDEDVDLNIFNGTAEEMDALRIQRKL